jgi:hypothetical protein
MAANVCSKYAAPRAAPYNTSFIAGPRRARGGASTLFCVKLSFIFVLTRWASVALTLVRRSPAAATIC